LASLPGVFAACISDLVETLRERRRRQRFAEQHHIRGLPHERRQRRTEIAGAAVALGQFRIAEAPHVARGGDDRAPAEPKTALIASSEGIPGEESHGGLQIGIIERAQILGDKSDLLELPGATSDRIRDFGKLLHLWGFSVADGGPQPLAAKPSTAMVTAFILMNVERPRLKSIADDLLAIDGVAEVYSVAGPFDLVVVARVKEHEQLNDLVTEHIAALDGIENTETLIAFRSFAKKDLGMLWDIGVD